MPPSSDDLSKYLIENDTSADNMQSILSRLSYNGKSSDTVFDPIDAVAAGLREGNAFFQLFKIIALMMARGIIAPVELLLRHNFGERYFNGLVGMAFLVCYGIAMQFLNAGKWCGNAILIEFFVLTALNAWICFFRDRDGDYWHSYSEGESRLRIQRWDQYFALENYTFDFSKLFIEPVVVIVVGAVCLIFPARNVDLIIKSFQINPFALYFFVAGIVLFFYQLYCFIYRHNLLLDEKDAEVMSEIRKKISSRNDGEGVFSHKGVAYSILGGKRHNCYDDYI
jgi:hypothetical protein